ncbi:phosphate signaling complex protein PhoU [Macromonas nakdongensis]|uniref:phosphate signaling complex protein PhoU n=1 Tax=Macromonas nakdongensis TaxID=1843082 RepID=UPI000C323DF2|nr:phosphate signaling complex protein PhoU [Macromonas nakdongensis]
MTDKHLSSQFDAELSNISTRVLEMGGLVESQLRQAIYALHHLSVETADQVLALEQKVNRLEVEIDHDITSTMSRRQPTARDLRLLVGVSRVIVNLERAGDEASRIARMTKSFIEAGAPRNLPVIDLADGAQLAADLMHKTLDAFARLDAQAALSIIDEDDRIDAAYEGYLRKLITYMMEDPRTISTSLNLLFLAKAIERVGDHAKNIAEASIYVAKGTDVRHTTAAQRESAVQ